MVLICKSNKAWIWLILHTRISSKEMKENSDRNKKYILRPFLINNNGLFSITVPAQILRQSWLERHVSILFSKICQFLTFYLVKSSPKNPRWKLERRRSICAGTVYSTYDSMLIDHRWAFRTNSWGKRRFVLEINIQIKFTFSKTWFESVKC